MSTTNISLQSVVQQNEELITSEIDGEVVMMGVENGKCYGMGAASRRVWELLAQPVRLETVIETLLEEFDVDREICCRDTLAFCNEMEKSKLIKVCP